MALFKLCVLSLVVILNVSLAHEHHEHGKKGRDRCVNWIRHEPKEWPRKYSEYKVTINGQKQDAWNQDLTDEFVPEVIDTYMNDFTKIEPLSKYAKCSESPECLKDYRTMLDVLIANKLSVIAVTKDSTGKKSLLGYRILMPHMMNACSQSQSNSPESTKINKVVGHLYKEVNFFKHLTVDKYLTSMGDYVLAPYRDETVVGKIGEQLIKDTAIVAKYNKFKYAASIFTDKASQRDAKAAGWTPLKQIAYSTLPEDIKLANIESESEFAEAMYVKATKK